MHFRRSRGSIPSSRPISICKTPQDQFTVFSLYMRGVLGYWVRENAARLLTLVFAFWFLAAAWSFASAVTGRDTAWLAVDSY